MDRSASNSAANAWCADDPRVRGGARTGYSRRVIWKLLLAAVSAAGGILLVEIGLRVARRMGKWHEHFLPAFMVRFTTFLGDITTHPTWKYVIAGGTVVLLIASTYVTLMYSQIGEAKPGTPLLFPDHEWNVATAEIAERFGGVDSIVVYLEGDKEKASGDALPILRMAEFERWMGMYTPLGATFSIVPILRTAWSMNHYGDPKWSFVSDDQAVVRQQIYQMRTNGAPGAMDPFLTQGLLKDHLRLV